MEAITWDVHTSSEELLVGICEQAEKENALGTPVVKLSDDIAVKFGHGMKASEARTQEFAVKMQIQASFIFLEFIASLNVPILYGIAQQATYLWNMCQARRSRSSTSM
jgi:hypothetical protein